MASEKLAILDAGAQYGKVIDRRIRELNVETEILPLDTPSEQLVDYKAIIISGGPQSVYDAHAPAYDAGLFALEKPILGICYGMQLLNHVAGGTVAKKGRREDGPCTIKLVNDSLLFSGLAKRERVLMSHGDSIDKLAAGYEVLAYSNGLVAAIQDPLKRRYGVQFHPEVDLTVNGKVVLKNFLYDIAGFSGQYTISDREDRAIAYIREVVGDRNVLSLVSGGVDSTVCTTLLGKALGSEKIIALHIDNGFMRLDESAKVKDALGGQGIDLLVVDASEDFYGGVTRIDGALVGPLRHTMSPEHKRKIIGDTFMKVAQAYIRKLGLDPEQVYLAQGTLRPDLIESASELASGTAEVIKTHHNDTQLVRDLRRRGLVVEPLREYHKDEVRALGESLGLPHDLVWRQPFPGPGLGVRIICAEKPYITDDFDFLDRSLHRHYSCRDVRAQLLPVQTVGVQGDGRSYGYLVGLSGVKDWGRLFKLADKIPKRFHEVNRVAYLFGGEVAGSIKEITPTYPRPAVIKQLQLADDIVNQVLLDYDLVKKLNQVPVISFPVNFGNSSQRSIAIRTFITNDFMTGRPAVPGEDFPEDALDTMVFRILREVPGVARVAYDLTSKPPGTTEWE